MSFKILLLSPDTDPSWEEKIRQAVPGVVVKSFSDSKEALDDIADADAAYGTVPLELLVRAKKLSEDDRDNLPERINQLKPAKFDNWLSEREWIPIMLETASRPRRLILKLDVDETNIDYLENTSCEEIFAERERQYQESYRKIPALDELCSRYGDPTNRRIYAMSRDVEGRWLELHERQTGTKAPID
jgi:hypothetical protein